MSGTSLCYQQFFPSQIKITASYQLLRRKLALPQPKPEPVQKMYLFCFSYIMAVENSVVSSSFKTDQVTGVCTVMFQIQSRQTIAERWTEKFLWKEHFPSPFYVSLRISISSLQQSVWASLPISQEQLLLDSTLALEFQDPARKWKQR